MARFADVAAGIDAFCIKTLPLLNDRSVTVAITALPFGEEGKAFAAARKSAIEQGVADPKPGDQIYERALAMHIVLASCFDPDKFPKERVKFFDSAQQIEALLDHDRVAMLFQWQRAWQREISPSPKGLTPQEYLKMVVATAEAEETEEIPFDYLPHSTQRALLRFTCVLCMSLLQLRSPSGSRLAESAEILIASLVLSLVERIKAVLMQQSRSQASPENRDVQPESAAPVGSESEARLATSSIEAPTNP